MTPKSRGAGPSSLGPGKAPTSGDHSVTYHFYKGITYTAKPVDAAYQSLNLSVPVEIDGEAVDALHAPIMLANIMGGYSSSSTTDATGVGYTGPVIGGGGGA